jgi:hypothetical protein
LCASNVRLKMREAAFREYAETTRRELAGLRKKVHDAIDAGGGAEQLVRDGVMSLWPRKRHHAPEPPAADDDALALDDPPPVDARSDFFARELGETWVEVEPGIYENTAPPQAGSPLRLATR